MKAETKTATGQRATLVPFLISDSVGRTLRGETKNGIKAATGRRTTLVQALVPDCVGRPVARRDEGQD